MQYFLHPPIRSQEFSHNSQYFTSSILKVEICRGKPIPSCPPSAPGVPLAAVFLRCEVAGGRACDPRRSRWMGRLQTVTIAVAGCFDLALKWIEDNSQMLHGAGIFTYIRGLFLG